MPDEEILAGDANAIPDDDDDQQYFVRSFVSRAGQGSGSRSAADQEIEQDAFRPFLVTGGRATTEFPLDFEAMVTVTPLGLRADVRFEQRTIVDRCIQGGSQSIAELAAYLLLPIGTVRVVASDMVGLKLLDVHTPDRNLSNDVLMLKRLINGVRAL
jgi:Protein of unknown function (DUF742)